ncbi:PREDICTED: SH3 domain-binding protein 5 homolog [Cyphomyrmex costatus]|uniref:SH3 domain-binding protein 5 like protein n=1 Tax=Cyphomyrmex costatus TaxID=456900 RepID=A0A195CJ51_9HYME|nr:PREDICTED: SH3 domain-binding protein 5 homolog [Cyphomyrmex costatus]XP_018397801.1 PREDICTED: SH3 domain-binding protein 5 homolog [Cyphomyrmex costatus]KYN00462.1 SH3 domain-binding protein 5 like protein [Cyphomyrmex costatus]
MDVAEDAEAALDPRIQIELENLNNAADDINKLETELDEAHTAFGQLLSDTTRRLKEITDKLGTSCIEKARCYYEALELAHQAQVQCQQQAQLFQRASEIHAAAKETVALAEARFMSHQHEWNFDQAWQDMLNHATIKVMDAENQKAECGREHHRKAMLFHDVEKKLLQLEEKHRHAIVKARPYFEMKIQCDQMLATQKERVEFLQQAVKEAKRNYATSLRTLEEISNQIHQQRRDYDIVANGPREPGVGAELIGSDTHQKYKSEFNNSDIHKISSPIRYNENENNEKLHDIEKPCSTKNDMEHLDKRSVDGSESKFTQWELELQTSMEKLNRLSIENSLRVKKRNAQSSSDLQDTAVEVSTVNRTCYNPLSELSNPRISNQFTRLIENPGTIERDRFNGKPYLLMSCSTIDSTTALRNTSTLAKSNISKSLNNSPVNRGTSNFEIIGSAGSANISKYVPNKISQFNIKDRKTQSSWDINIPYNANVTNRELERDSCSNTNDTLVNKSHVQLTNLHVAQVSNVEFLPEESSLSRHHVAATPVVSQHLKSSHNDVALLQSRSSSNSQKSAPCSANSSPIKLKNLLLSSARSLDTESADQLDKGSISKKFASRTTSIKELPLLSLFRQTSALSAFKGKSSSMINLGGKQNLKTLLENSPHLSNIQAISAERLANVRHKLVNDCLETKTGDVKK